MDKEKVTEELVRQNGNQAAAVMADYAGQGGGGGGSASKGVYGTLVDVSELPCFKPMSEWPTGPVEALKLSDVLADGYRLIHYYSAAVSHQEEFSFYIVKVTGENPTISLDGEEGLLVSTDCEPVYLDVPPFAPDYIVLRTLILDFQADDIAYIVGWQTLEGKDLPDHYDSMDETPLVCETVFLDGLTGESRIAIGTYIIVAEQH